MATTQHDAQLVKRRNTRLALIHVAVALGFMIAFMWVQAHR